MPLVVTTNAKAADLAPRTGSRLSDRRASLVVSIDAKDFRLVEGLCAPVERIQGGKCHKGQGVPMKLCQFRPGLMCPNGSQCPGEEFCERLVSFVKTLGMEAHVGD